MIPKELRYLESHEWAGLDKDTGIVTVGLSEYAIEQLGDIVFLELPEIGDNVTKGAEFCTIESVKAASDLYVPVSGEIVEVNEELTENLDLFKTGAYEHAWIARIKADDIAEFETLISAEDYEKLLKE
jgi:glycine cleavage system H protein